VSRPDDRGKRPWDDGAPTFKERLRLAIRQSPMRGLVIVALLGLSLVFLVGALLEFSDAIWAAIAGFGAALLAGDLTAVLAVVALLVAVGTATLLLRRS